MSWIMLRNRVVRRAVILVQRGVDVFIRRHPQFNLGIDHPLQRVNGVQVRGIGQRHGDGMVVFGNRHGPVALGHVPRDGGDHVVGQAHVRQIDEFVAEVGGLGLGDIRGRDDFAGKQQVNDSPSPLAGCFLAHGHKLLVADTAPCPPTNPIK